MAQHLTPQQQNALLTRTLSAAELPACLAHVAECAACRAPLSQTLGASAALETLPESFGAGLADWSPAHLAYAELTAYVQNRLDRHARELADNHLAACQWCTEAVAELAALDRELAALPSAAGVVAADAQAPLAAHWLAQTWQRLKLAGGRWAALNFEWNWPVGALAGGALCVLLSWGAWQLGRTPATSAPELAQSTPPAFRPTVEPAVSPAVTPAAVAPSETLLALVDHGQALTLGTDGQLRGPADWPPALTRAVERTLAQQQLALPSSLPALTPAPSTLKGSAETVKSFALQAPRGVVSASDRPTFRWEAVPAAEAYTVAVFDLDFNPVLTSASLNTNSWRPAQALPRGRTYLWQVTAQVGATQLTAPQAPAPEARFQVLSRRQADELQVAQRRFSQSHLLLGTLYAQAGLVDEAVREFQALQAENPQSPVVKKLLAQLRAKARS